LQDFGPGRGYLHNGPHGGMASSAILEPMMWLYWETGDQRYLDFGRWLVDEDWEAAGGVAICTSLLSGRGVAGTANGKAAEMLIDFTGLTEFYRATGDEHYLQPVLIAWDDIVQHHLYITGSASTGEHFFPDYLLRNDGLFRLGETCVTMTWLYLNLSLGRLTGEARFFDMAEQALYNHLLAAQSPDGRGWAYYMGLRDHKRYRWHTDPDCCPTRGVRALAQMPQHVFGITDDGVAVHFYEPAEAMLTLASGIKLKVTQEGEYPFGGKVRLRLDPQEAARFALRLRVPGWCRAWQLKINGAVSDVQPDGKGYLVCERTWSAGDTVELDMEMPVHVVTDVLGNAGRVAVLRGPLVYAVDASYLPQGRLLDDITLVLNKANPAQGIRVVKDEGSGVVHLVAPAGVLKPAPGAGAWREKERYHDLAACAGKRSAEEVTLVPFYEAGNRDPKAYREVVITNTEAATNVTYQVWLPYTCT
ncbi:MAG: glycoside hydrolase family 127 protein, partial [Gammaproteobacteria bacterium]|nr:glycoside hydrolase family 127 protein [Gammaproteobacteria bacterium]